MACVEALQPIEYGYAPVPRLSQTVLLVSTGRTDGDILQSLIADSTTRLKTVRSYREAVTALARDSFALIICDERLPDGSWKDVLGHIALLPEAPRLAIIASDPSESLYAEALNLGVWELLHRPIEAEEARRVLELGTIVTPRKHVATATRGR